MPSLHLSEKETRRHFSPDTLPLQHRPVTRLSAAIIEQQIASMQRSGPFGRHCAGRDEGVAVLTLLGHGDPSVRLWAASHALQVAPDKAEPVLEALAAESGPQPWMPG